MKSFEVAPRSLDFGGGWKLTLFENGVNKSDSIFHPGDDNYCEAVEKGEAWVSSGSETGVTMVS